MMKWIFGLLLLVNVSFFAVMRWGGELTVDANNPPVQAALNADKMRLLPLSESPASAVAAAVPVAVSAVVAASQVVATSHVAAAVVPRVKLSCMEWGEFSGSDLQRVEKALGTLKLGVRLKQRLVEYGSGYWVYIPPVKTHTQVEKKIAQLKAYGVVDYFVIQEAGQWQNAISLGVFKIEEAAKKFLAKLQEQGVKSAAVGERATKLRFTVFVLHDLDSALSSRIAALRQDFPESDLKLVACNANAK